MKKQSASVPATALSPGLRRYLYLTATVTGAAIMIVEILGAKMLAPYVGTSHFVWTAQIAVTLVALAAGYYVGGRLVDRSQKLDPLYAAVLVAGIYLCMTVAAVRPVAYWCLDFKLALGSLLASIFLFFIPLALLAMVGPFFVRVLTSSVQGVGGNVGRLTALSTLGSFGGTILIGYILIPLLPNSWIMYLTAGALLCVVGIYFVVWRRRSHHVPPVSLGLLIGLLGGYGGIRLEARPEFTSAIQRFRGNSNFGQLQVIDMLGGSRRFYMNDYLVQNAYDPIDGRSVALFSYMLHDLAYAYTPSIRTALCIGLGVGIVPSDLASEGVKVDVVEINPAVVPVAREYFGCRPENFRLTIGDGRQFANRSTNRYDVVVLDAFLGDSSPSHLMSREAFQSIWRLLNTNGTLVINSFADFKEGRDFFGASLEKTLKTVFKNVRIHTSPRGNVFFVASDRDELSVVRTPNFNAIYPTVREEARICFDSVTEADPSHGIVLSDDFNPVEFRDAANRERIRRQLAMGMREL